ncbi:MAG: ribonuclease H-like domain-containing protein [Roseburia sp.]
MKIWHETQDFSFEDPIIDTCFTEQSLFFDIETTGFSPARTSVYLIGCGERQGTRLIIHQFFAEKPEEEKEVICAFLAFLEHFDTILTFNGIGFDIPYLKAKCSSLKITEHFDDFCYVDIYKIISRQKTLLGLPNCKQKSVEAFLGIHREDTYTGGELIDVYKEYVTHPSEEGLFLLKQHNFEDVLGMPQLLAMLAYPRFFDSDCRITGLSANEYTAMDGSTGHKELFFNLCSEISLPRRISCRTADFYLIADGNTARLSVKLFDGVLKFFYDNPKDYYYLPDEDTAYPKSIASGMDKAHRKQATRSTCYTRKDGIFLPEYEPIVTPVLYENSPREKKGYFELSEDFLSSGELQTRYIRHVFRQFTARKQKVSPHDTCKHFPIT